jgi:hypothetical protein
VLLLQPRACFSGFVSAGFWGLGVLRSVLWLGTGEREGDGGGKGETLAWKGTVGRSPSGSGSMWAAGAPFGLVLATSTIDHRRLVINK